MIELLEIPVFTTDLTYAEKFFKEYDLHNPNGTNDYRYCIMETDRDKDVLFHILNLKENMANVRLFDRVVPRAPFCMILLEGETFLVNNFYEFYRERYDSALICLAPQPLNDFDLTYVNNVILAEEANRMVSFEPADSNRHKKILIEVLHHVLDRPV